MFGFLKKKTEEVELMAVEQTTEEMLGLKEFVSIDSVKAHLVDILEENRRLKKELKENRDENKEWLQREKKQKEVALIEAEEWKKRAAEKDKEIQKLQKEIDRTDKKIEELTSEKKSLNHRTGNGKKRTGKSVEVAK